MIKRMSDEHFIEIIRSGDASGFAPLLERYSKQVFALLVRMTGNREDAQDLSQDVFIKVFGSLPSFRGDCSFSTWLYRIAYNMGISSTRKARSNFVSVDLTAELQELEEDAAFSSSDDETLTDSRLDLLETALDRLPPDERAMITLFYKDERSMSEIAGITGLTETNVKTRIFRIRKRLYVLIKEMEDQNDR
ncbi:MAG: sigma-70 family RNA polymerase sigma factor [Tannerella sp.]|jgi:RNA polymerase sigma-70 factor (ECF subfamily)|nr:sigma-70 family RNA polymerase sigma factor [Tannerella sp.]